MGLFKSKADKEFEKKRLIKKTVYDMNKQIAALEDQKKVFVQKATEAKKNGLEAQYNLAITGYKMTLTQQRRAQEMLLNFEITSQMKDMTLMTKQFLGGMSVLSKEMAKLADEKEFVQVQKQFEVAMGKAEMQAEQMEMFMESSQDSFSAAAGSGVKDGEIKEMIEQQAGMSDEFSDEAIDKEIEELKKKIESQI
ncbi:MAG: hypothetical protein LUF82_03550 [Clostridia bacterium]|nr:hypothetical protein [Clostridia bacterium]